MEKMTIYLDLLFLENFVLNYIILIGTAIILKIKINYFKIGVRWNYRKYICSNKFLHKI